MNKALNKNEFMEGMEDYKKQRKTIKKTRNISMTVNGKIKITKKVSITVTSYGEVKLFKWLSFLIKSLICYIGVKFMERNIRGDLLILKLR